MLSNPVPLISKDSLPGQVEDKMQLETGRQTSPPLPPPSELDMDETYTSSLILVRLLHYVII